MDLSRFSGFARKYAPAVLRRLQVPGPPRPRRGQLASDDPAYVAEIRAITERARGEQARVAVLRLDANFGTPTREPEHVLVEDLGADWTRADWQALFDERAAILEYDQGLRRAEAERLAQQQIEAAPPSQLVP
jgi:hypothetical protein